VCVCVCARANIYTHDKTFLQIRLIATLISITNHINYTQKITILSEQHRIAILCPENCINLHRNTYTPSTVRTNFLIRQSRYHRFHVKVCIRHIDYYFVLLKLYIYNYIQAQRIRTRYHSQHPRYSSWLISWSALIAANVCWWTSFSE